MAPPGVAVFWPRESLCRGSDYARPVASAGFLASTVTEATGCGSAETPWLLQVARGQRVNLTLHDFSAVVTAMNASRGGGGGGGAGGKTRPHCHVLAIIKVRACVCECECV